MNCIHNETDKNYVCENGGKYTFYKQGKVKLEYEGSVSKLKYKPLRRKVAKWRKLAMRLSGDLPKIDYDKNGELPIFKKLYEIHKFHREKLNTSQEGKV